MQCFAPDSPYRLRKKLVEVSKRPTFQDRNQNRQTGGWTCHFLRLNSNSVNQKSSLGTSTTNSTTRPSSSS